MLRGMKPSRIVPLFLAALCLIGISTVVRATAPNEPYPVRLRVGQTFSVCRSGTIICPAVAPICDNPSVATGELSPEGLVFLAVEPGTTLCSAGSGSAEGPRRVYRIKVVP